MKALILFSGGLDSTTCLAKAIQDFDEVEALSFNYGQKHIKELDHAVSIADYYGIKLKIYDITGLVEKSESDYIPFRNTIFLSIALSYAEQNNIDVIIYGANSADYDSFPDCRLPYVEAINNLVKTHTMKIIIITPIINTPKTEIIKLAKSLDVPIEMTWTCYEGTELPCGKCNSCLLRDKAFKEISC